MPLSGFRKRYEQVFRSSGVNAEVLPELTVEDLIDLS
jgi:hypothetical protein